MAVIHHGVPAPVLSFTVLKLTSNLQVFLDQSTVMCPGSEGCKKHSVCDCIDYLINEQTHSLCIALRYHSRVCQNLHVNQTSWAPFQYEMDLNLCCVEQH